MSKGSKRTIIGSASSDCSTEDLILKDDEMSSPNGLLTTEPYLNYVVEVPQGSKRPCTFLNKFLILIAFLFFITTVVLLGLYLHELNVNKRKQTFCTTADCVEASAFMKSAMEETVNPCDDFYEYSCGGWLAKNPIPDGKSKVSVDSVLWDVNLNTMRGILMNISTHNISKQSEAIHKSVTLFKTCNNMDAVKKLGAKPIRILLKKIGDFDTSNTSNNKPNVEKKKEKLLDLVQKMYDEAHLFPYFAVVMSIDDKDSKKYRLKVTQNRDGLGLEPFRYKMNRTDTAIQAYLSFLTELGMKLISNVPRETVKSMAEETYLFEKQLAEIFVPLAKQTTVEQTYHKITFQKLQEQSNSIDYLSFVKHMFKAMSLDIAITGDEPILIDTLDFFKKLDSVVGSTDIKIIQNYIMFTVAKSYLKFLTEDFILLSKNLTMAQTGDSKELPRWKTCVWATDSGMGMALGSLFVEKTFAHSSYREANDLVEEVRKAFIGILPKLEWMDPETVKAAKEKALAINQKIGYPKFIEDPKKLDKYYEGLTLVPDQYFENQRTILKFHLKKAFKRLRQEVDESLWYMSPPTINAYYNPSGNQIVFPAGILQPPFFKAGYPKSLNFGSMGAVIGHEITHGFDNNGRLYDAQGNYGGKGNSWWSTTSVDGFKARTTCFVDQYSSFTVAGQKIKGNVTLGENIADNGGLKAAFNAYSNWVKQHGAEMLLPGLQNSNEEVFFIAFGQSWCTGELNKRLQSLLETDVHSPFKERVKGSVQNSEDFARVFKCPLGSPMNPKKKCSIW